MTTARRLTPEEPPRVPPALNDPELRAQVRECLDEGASVSEMSRFVMAIFVDAEPRPTLAEVREFVDEIHKNGGGRGGRKEEAALTWRTLADVDNSPLEPLLLEMFEPAGPNMIYGGGGVGKGSTCAWGVVECQKLGIKTLIYDAEGHPQEWRRRVEGLGGALADVLFVEPHELPQDLMGRPLHEIVPHLGNIARTAGCGLIIVDSILAGANLSEEGLKSNAAAPYLYVRALSTIGIPSISIGHTPKNSASGDPYGSVSWINAMRLTWLGTRADEDGHSVRWTPRKRNERGRIAAVRLTFRYDELGQLYRVERRDDEQAVRDWLTTTLMELGEATVAELAEEMTSDNDDGNYAAALERAKDTIGRTLRRMKRAGQAHTRKASRPARWALADGKMSGLGRADSTTEGVR